ncbi:MAG: thioredoxin domain-containing protein [Chloroflexota bacterium]|nr:thioredoxin domain-containing protein [Chloroflexota bacterium]
MTNRLAAETSPYLLQHAHNPVDWYPWGHEALERARTEDKPIFLSIGYSACHWCHVMAHESFEDPAIAAQLNRDFVAIKVDREERPDLDDVYMAAVQAMTGGGGWPMSVFLTPTLEPFFGGTYFPPDDRHGLPAFPKVLAAIADAYATRRDEVVAQGRELAAHLQQQLSIAPGGAGPQRRQLETASARLLRDFDPLHGGFGPAPKFPAPMTLEFLLRAWRLNEDPQTLRAVTLTLDRMADGGIWDQLGGGFARYSTDARWLVPHFEKMLYDNAQLAHAYLEAFRATGRSRYAAVSIATLDFMLSELATAEGGFASALDADSEGEEGRFYAWDHEQLTSVLAAAGLDAEAIGQVAAHWDVTPQGNWEGRSILHVAGERPPAQVLERARSALLAARGLRVRPGRDDKQLAAWNGMALRSFADGYLVFGEERFLAAARRLVAFIRDRLLRDGDRLWRTARDGVAHTPAFAEDYANVADGLLAAYAAGGDPADLQLAESLIGRVVADFWDDESGTLFDTGPEHDAVVARARSLTDGATPGANSVAADVLLRLAVLTGEADHDRRARRILAAAAPALDRQPSSFGRMLSAADRALGETIDVVIAGEPDDPRAVVLRREAARPYAPDLIIAPLPVGDPLGERPLFVAKEARAGQPTAYVCRGYSCDSPTADPVEVARQLATMTATRLAG